MALRYTGVSGVSYRLGRAMALRAPRRREYHRLKRAARGGPVGPHLPLILEACREEQYAYEYRDGVTSYGAFTYSLAQTLRRLGGPGRGVTFRRLVEEVRRTLTRLRDQQEPQILGPGVVVNARVPWRPGRPPAGPAGPGPRPARRPGR